MCNPASSSTWRLNQPEARVRDAPPDGLDTLWQVRGCGVREKWTDCMKEQHFETFCLKTITERGVCYGSLEVGCTGLRSVGDKHYAKGCAGQQTGMVSTPKSLLHITRDRRLLRFKCSLPPGSMKISLTFSGSRVLSRVVQVCRFWKFPWKNPTMCLVCDCFPLVDRLYGPGPLGCVSCSQSRCCAIASVRSSCCKQRNKQKITF